MRGLYDDPKFAGLCQKLQHFVEKQVWTLPDGQLVDDGDMHDLNDNGFETSCNDNDFKTSYGFNRQAAKEKKLREHIGTYDLTLANRLAALDQSFPELINMSSLELSALQLACYKESQHVDYADFLEVIDRGVATFLMRRGVSYEKSLELLDLKRVRHLLRVYDGGASGLTIADMQTLFGQVNNAELKAYLEYK